VNTLSLHDALPISVRVVSSLRNVVFCNINRTVFLDKDRTMGNVEKHNTRICTSLNIVLIRFHC
jgi:hypothetical protein